MRRTDSLIEVLLSEPELNKYNVTVEQMAQHKPFPSKIIEDLMEKAASEYHMEFDIDHCRRITCKAFALYQYNELIVFIHSLEVCLYLYMKHCNRFELHTS